MPMQLALEPAVARPMTHETAGTSASELDDIDALVRTHRARLLRFVAFSVGDADVAESITQDCFLKAWNARHTFRGDCSVQTFLNGIALNLVRDHHRLGRFRFWRKARATAIDVSEAAAFLPSHGSSPEAQLIACQKAAQVQSALATLSPHQRSVFLMRFSEEMDLPEIASAMGMPINTVKTHLHRALKAVRSQIGSAR